MLATKNTPQLHNELILFLPSFLCGPLLKRSQTHGSAARAARHTGVPNLITCFICHNLFLNQSGLWRKLSSRAAFTPPYLAVLDLLMQPWFYGHIHVPQDFSLECKELFQVSEHPWTATLIMLLAAVLVSGCWTTVCIATVFFCSQCLFVPWM